MCLVRFGNQFVDEDESVGGELIKVLTPVAGFKGKEEVDMTERGKDRGRRKRNLKSIMTATDQGGVFGIIEDVKLLVE